MDKGDIKDKFSLFEGPWAEVAECLRHYYRAISPNMPLDTKKNLLRRMVDYMDEHGLRDDNPVEDFPELKKYWRKESLSQIDLAVTANCLGHDLYKPYKA